MSEHFLHPDVFIRSMATRGSLGGLAPRIFEVADLFRASDFDYVIIETVGVGQNEVEIASLADLTVLVLVPEAGDEIQAFKNGVMEIADIYVVNKADREGIDVFFRSLMALVHGRKDHETPVLKTTALTHSGIKELLETIEKQNVHPAASAKKNRLLAEKAMGIIREQRTRDIPFDKLLKDISENSGRADFNLYQYIAAHFTPPRNQ
jgi:LAO/AO transport system kinase